MTRSDLNCTECIYGVTVPGLAMAQAHDVAALLAHAGPGAPVARPPGPAAAANAAPGRKARATNTEADGFQSHRTNRCTRMD